METEMNNQINTPIQLLCENTKIHIATCVFTIFQIDTQLNNKPNTKSDNVHVFN